MAIRSDLERKRMNRLKPGEVITVLFGNSTRKATVIHNFKNAMIIDFKMVAGRFLWFPLHDYHTYAYEWDGFTITLKEDLI